MPMPCPDASPAPTLIQAAKALVATVRTLFTRALTTGLAPTHQAAAPTTQLPKLARALYWLNALARTLAGDHRFLPPIAFPRFAGRYPALTAKLRAEIGLPPLPAPTTYQREAARAAARLHYMRRVFATVPTGTIASRLARRIGLTEASPAWPIALACLTATPALLAKSAPPRASVPRPPGVDIRHDRHAAPPDPQLLDHRPYRSWQIDTG